MDRRHLLTLSGALLVGALAGCTEDTDGGPTDDEEPTETGDDDDNKSDDDGSDTDEDQSDDENSVDIDDEALEELVIGANGFAFDLYRELSAESNGENLFGSPVSISIALAMAYAGAEGATRTQMRDALRYTLDDEELHAAMADLQDRLADRGGEDSEDGGGAYDSDDEQIPFELSIVNSVWGQEAYPFAQSYLDLLDDHYGGGLREVDYIADPESARATINDWVADETEDRIDELLPQNAVDRLTRLVLVNAVYFLANWEHPFSEEATSQETFTAIDGTAHEVPMMYNNRNWSYAEVDGAQAVELPYVGNEAAMLVILPPEGEFESYEQSLDSETLDSLVTALEGREGTVRLPRFEFETGFALADTLEALGMVDAFAAQAANFDGMVDRAETDEPLFLDNVYHDAFVAVDEAGTEAAAATAVVAGTTSAPVNPFSFVADRPFLFAIRDRPTGAVLLLGRVTDPAGWD